MAIHNVWLLPVFISFYSILTLLICYSVAAASHHVPPRWPFLSEIATRPPESCLHTMMMNHMSILLALWMYVKHAEVLSFLSLSSSFPTPLSPSQSSYIRRLSSIGMFIGLFAAASLQISANYPSHKVPYIEGYATVISSLAWSIYICLHSVVSLSVIDPTIPRKGIFVARLSLAVAVISFSTSTLRTLIVTGSFSKMKGESWTAAVCEWGVYMSLSLFLLTDSYEFRSLSISALKLIIPGSSLYEDVASGSMDRSFSNASDFDPRVTYLRQPLIR